MEGGKMNDSIKNKVIKKLQVALTMDKEIQNKVIKELKEAWDNDRSMNSLIDEAILRMNNNDFVV